MSDDNIIISDASPLAIFDKIESLFILKETFDSITITKEVKQEFEAKGSLIPEWMKIETFQDTNKFQELRKDLDIGEASAITLALESKNPFLIIDERKGRNKAGELNIDYTGSLGVLLLAKESNVIQAVKPYLDKILNTDFRASQIIINRVLYLAGES